MKQDNYYAEKLNSQGLFKAYETNLPRVKQYLNAEIEFVKNHLTKQHSVLELGAGYGRIVKQLADSCKNIIGIDISYDSVALGNESLADIENAKMLQMDVHNLTFQQKFDVVLCLQNGLSAMKITSAQSIKNILTLVEDGGSVFFSTYSDKFWNHRVAWFKEQADKGLLGELDMQKTKNGVIVCKDGFKATTHNLVDLQKMGEATGCKYELKEVDESSLFLIIHK
ncbi:methyltransferase domain-containing protein [Clostridium sp. 'deep sea']|uniref:class I SAM-dependent methyltransferase n=1 Tax=Clostridium sp. 'deep sea' TaxID=2779445 RepID=UPI0018965927|nr:class I SAM-dependent methyltransferase [Clostridium sp. 'deep sea']QOR34882.1 methyltransferase domain-containing protein [Clostridium sp. 'deep sea']